MRTLQIQDKEEIHQIIRSCKTCYLALSDHEFPYVVPMNFALDGDNVILHSAQSGRKWEMIRKNPRVCINWTLGERLAWQDIGVGCSYRVKSKSVVAEGIAEIVEDHESKLSCMEKLMAQYSDLTFKFSAPSIRNVGVIRIRIEKISAKKFGAKAITPWNKREKETDED